MVCPLSFRHCTIHSNCYLICHYWGFWSLLTVSRLFTYAYTDTQAALSPYSYAAITGWFTAFTVLSKVTQSLTLVSQAARRNPFECQPWLFKRSHFSPPGSARFTPNFLLIGQHSGFWSLLTVSQLFRLRVHWHPGHNFNKRFCCHCRPTHTFFAIFS